MGVSLQELSALLQQISEVVGQGENPDPEVASLLITALSHFDTAAVDAQGEVETSSLSRSQILEILFRTLHHRIIDAHSAVLATIFLAEPELKRIASDPGSVDAVVAQNTITRILRCKQILQDFHDELQRITQLREVLLSELKLETLTVRDLVSAVEVSVASAVQEAGVTLEIDCDRGLQIRGDRQKIHRMIKALVSGAIQDANPGTHLSVCVQYSSDKEHILLSITNPTQRKKSSLDLARLQDDLLTESLQIRTVLPDNIGFIVIQTIVYQHGGHITLTDFDQGVKFMVSLPVGDLSQIE